ncbi:MAG: hypothetical protein R3314_00845 [Longimicrobiales bacterium]|nr:hypothetical protein [Longimicrobiales bacterium]
MSRIAFLVPLAAMTLTACGGMEPDQPPPPDTIVRLDTITITREVEPPLPEGRLTTLCLANGENAEIRISPAGDTLIGPERVALADLGPAIGFIGSYADDETWFVEDEAVTFERRQYSKFGQPASRDCRGMKIVGDTHGVNLFAEVTASSPFEVLYVPVRPGVFQSYQSQVGRVRG